MIPKTIHYCWFGRNPKPKLAEKCIESWKKFCPDYEIIEWNEDNYDVTKIPYMKEAYEEKKWGFVPDYARLDIIYQYGGIYLDTDVELLRPIGDLLQYKGFAGLEDGKYVALGLGFGAEEGHPMLKVLMESYENDHFLSGAAIPAPTRDTVLFLDKGFIQKDSQQIVNGLTILPTDFLCPLDWQTRKLHKTANTHSIHWYSASWWDEQTRKDNIQRIKQEKKFKRRNAILDPIRQLTKTILGEKNYYKIKRLFKGD